MLGAIIIKSNPLSIDSIYLKHKQRKFLVMERRTFIKNAAFASGTLLTIPSLIYSTTGDEYDFPLLDLHVHTLHVTR